MKGCGKVIQQGRKKFSSATSVDNMALIIAVTELTTEVKNLNNNLAESKEDFKEYRTYVSSKFIQAKKDSDETIAQVKLDTENKCSGCSTRQHVRMLWVAVSCIVGTLTYAAQKFGDAVTRILFPEK